MIYTIVLTALRAIEAIFVFLATEEGQKTVKEYRANTKVINDTVAGWFKTVDWANLGGNDGWNKFWNWVTGVEQPGR